MVLDQNVFGPKVFWCQFCFWPNFRHDAKKWILNLNPNQFKMQYGQYRYRGYWDNACHIYRHQHRASCIYQSAALSVVILWLTFLIVRNLPVEIGWWFLMVSDAYLIVSLLCYFLINEQEEEDIISNWSLIKYHRDVIL